MNFFKYLTSWALIEILFLIAIAVGDNLLNEPGGLWPALVIVFINSWISIHADYKYKFELPVNHPDQKYTDKDVLGNLIRSLLCITLCFASIRLGSAWMSVAGGTLMIVATYATYRALQLYLFVKEDVKFEG